MQKDDVIYRQAAIDAMNSYYELVETATQAGTILGCIDCITMLPSAQPEQRWIPVTERLPEPEEDEDIDIIVTYVDDEETRIIPVNYGKGTWYDCIFDTALNPIKVIAWMPLPDPYREE